MEYSNIPQDKREIVTQEMAMQFSHLNNNNNLYLHYSGRIKKRTNIENKIIENL